MYGVLLLIWLEENNIILVLLMILVNSRGSICSAINLKSFQKFHDFQNLVERMFSHKIITIQSD